MEDIIFDIMKNYPIIHLSCLSRLVMEFYMFHIFILPLVSSVSCVPEDNTHVDNFSQLSQKIFVNTVVIFLSLKAREKIIQKFKKLMHIFPSFLYNTAIKIELITSNFITIIFVH